jgi:hypothetical protein
MARRDPCVPVVLVPWQAAGWRKTTMKQQTHRTESNYRAEKDRNRVLLMALIAILAGIMIEAVLLYRSL